MAQKKIKLSHKFWFAAAGALGFSLLGMGIGFAVLLSGSYDTAATKQHFAITHWILDLGLRYSVRTAAADITVPPLDRPGLAERGLVCYQIYCVQCHGAPAISPQDQGKGLMPIPTALAQSARDWPAAWLYYVTKKGIRMTGMPAWEFRMSEDSLWSTVAFLKTLPTLTANRYQQLQLAAREYTCARNLTAPVRPTREYAQIILRQYACHSCHEIEEMVGPKSQVGPPLIDWSRRKYISGALPNTRENLVRWIQNPQAISPQTLMPSLDVPDAHARVMADYLMNLK